MCSTVQEVDQIDKQENSDKCLIDITYLVNTAKQRISRGEIPKKTATSVSPLEFLDNIRGKQDREEGRKPNRKIVTTAKKDEDEDASMNPGSEEEEEDTDLEEEK